LLQADDAVSGGSRSTEYAILPYGDK